MDAYIKNFIKSVQKANMLKCSILLFLLTFPTWIVTSKAEDSICGIKVDDPLKMVYIVRGGNVDSKTHTGEIHPGETISASAIMANGFTDSNGIKDWNHLILQISANGEPFVEKTYNGESFPSATGSYTVKDTDNEIIVWFQTSSEYFLPYGSTTRIADIQVRYKVIKKENKNTNSNSSSSSSSYRSTFSYSEKEEDVCKYCGAPDSKIRFNDLYGEVSYRCNSEEDDAYEYAEFDTHIYEEDRIRTKDESGAILGFEDMSTFVIKPNSILVIHSDEDKTTKFDMLMGRIWGNIQKMREGKTIGFEMSQCVAGIKGTVFALEETGTESRAWLFTSKMDVTSKRTGETINLEPGQMARVGTDGIIHVEDFNILEAANDFDIPLTEIGGWYATHNPWYIVAAIAIVIVILILPVIVIVIIVSAILKKKKNCNKHVNNNAQYNTINPVPAAPSTSAAQYMAPMPPTPPTPSNVVRETPSIPTPTSVPPTPPPPPSNAANYIICSQCGTKNELEAKYCEVCGNKLN